MSHRVTVYVLAVFDGVFGAPDMAQLAIRGTNASVRVPAARVAEDAGIPVSELPGREFTALLTMGIKGDEYSDFRLVNDPRT
ncbi:hypothetical protein Ssi03_62470 [Sphaerisporangium siamense]|uniref:Uncharacterized protein n=1 Tax=Sphaerisporangium siamense TaxID=795645 RepID=A0A7W7D973_9ACTN|nr:hypothetical protein [Sphaerisporangium siamense]MBB4702557.1 hypothetical protein [Sphaerisporangium siamense]GII88257.1 hypothetical protein Ssi03_62470 [Sphaerisporangium siamense]